MQKDRVPTTGFLIREVKEYRCFCRLRGRHNVYIYVRLDFCEGKKKDFTINSDLQVVRCTILHGEKGLDTTATAMTNDHDD